MCNLNILFVKKKLRTITPFLMATTSHSFTTNDDGEGFYTDYADKVHKQKDKIDLFEFENEIENSNVIITHQRLSTSGFEIEYNHPFENTNFVMVHNGVINQFKGDIGSDTYGFWLKFNKEFDSLPKHLNRDERVKKVICKLFKEDVGSYSILIYDKKTKLSFYFKGNGYPPIYFYNSPEYLFITTNADNKIFLHLLGESKFQKLAIEGRTIYKISKLFTCYTSTKLPKEQYEHQEKLYFNSKSNERQEYVCEDCGEVIVGTVYQKHKKYYCFTCNEEYNK